MLDYCNTFRRVQIQIIFYQFNSPETATFFKLNFTFLLPGNFSVIEKIILPYTKMVKINCSKSLVSQRPLFCTLLIDFVSPFFREERWCVNPLLVSITHEGKESHSLSSCFAPKPMLMFEFLKYGLIKFTYLKN